MPDKLVVVAIDLGSHGSGYAFSFRHEYEANPVNVSTPMWSPESGRGTSEKTPSTILLDSKKKFVAFGFDAEDKFTEICKKNEQNSWYYLKGFKMKLYRAVMDQQDIRKDFEMKDINGKPVSAKLVIELSFKYLRQHLLDMFKQRNIGVEPNDIFWVVTVPAIWNDACKQFMRDAAVKAGMPDNMISIVYEPEAASVYARLLPVERFYGENKSTILKTFDEGTKFIVVDAGGGTVDISTQQVATNKELRIIHKVCGGSWGGEMVNEKFRGMLIKIVSAPILREFRLIHGQDYNELISTFESKKKQFKTEDNKNVVVRFPLALRDLTEDKTEDSIDNLIENSHYKGKLSVKRDKMHISSDVFESFLKDCCQLTIEEIQKVLDHPRCEDAKAIMMVGGFSECDMLRKAVKKAFPRLEVFIPTEGSLSVLKGATIYGHNPNIVASRVCNYTYGISVSVPFKTGQHPESKRYTWDNEQWCRHKFEVCYIIDEEVKVGDVRKIEMNDTFVTADSQCRRSQPLKVEVYISDQAAPQFVTDEGCKKHAVITVNPPGGVWPEQVLGWVELEVASTEMIGTYVNASDYSRTSTRFEFLPSGYECPAGEKKRLFDPDEAE